MNQYNISTDEITKVITLYSSIPTPEKRIYAQGYLNGLGAFPAHKLSAEKETKNPKQTA